MKAEPQKVNFWISLDMLSCNRHPEGSQLCEEMGLHLARPYQLLQHAEDKLIGKPSDLDLVDIITTLKRAAFHRKAAIEDIMSSDRFRSLPYQKIRWRDCHSSA